MRTVTPSDGENTQLSSSSGTSCDPDTVTFTTNVPGATVRLMRITPIPTILIDEVTSDPITGKVSFALGTNGTYQYRVTKSGDFVAYESTFSYTLCIPVIPPECSDTIPCPSGQQCVSGQCEPECNEDTDCASGEYCLSGQCEPIPPDCLLDSDCPSGMVCESEKCVPEPPECETDADCPAGYTCEGGTCNGVPGIDGEPPENPVTNPNSNTTLEFTVTNNGTAPIHNVFVTVDSGFSGTSTTIPVLNPGESGTITVIMPIGDLLPGDYIITAIYGSDEISSTEQFVLKVSEIVTPGIVWANLIQCLIPALVLLLLGLLFWFFLRKKIVVDQESLKELAKANKLSFMNKYLIAESMYAKLGKELMKKCEAVKVSKADVSAIMKKDGLSEEDATLIAVAIKAKAKNVISESKSFAKFAKLHQKLEGVEFTVPESIIKGK